MTDSIGTNTNNPVLIALINGPVDSQTLVRINELTQSKSSYKRDRFDSCSGDSSKCRDSRRNVSFMIVD